MDMSNLSERDRRILLREMERKNRLQNGQQNQQQYGGPPIVNSQPDIFGQPKTSAQIEQSKRDLNWQQQLQQKMTEQSPSYLQQNNFKPLELQQPTAFTPSTRLDMQLPIYNRDFSAPDPNNNFGAKIQIPSHLSVPSEMAKDLVMENRNGLMAPSPVRISMNAQRFQQAKELDNSLKFDDKKYPQNQKPSLSPLIQNQKLKQMDQNFGIIQALGNNELDKARRENTKKQVQQEYNHFLANQQPRKIGNLYEGDGFNIGANDSYKQRASSANRRIPDVDSSLLAAGAKQVGILPTRNQQEDDKQKKLQEHKAMAMINLQMAAAKKDQSQAISQDQRKKQIVDQVFEEVVDSVRQNVPVYQHQPQVQIGLPPRQSPAINKRQADMIKLQNQSAEDPFFKARMKQDDQKRLENEKKREYAAILVQQMEAKKQRNTHSQPILNQAQQNVYQRQQQPAFQPQYQQPQQYQQQQNFDQKYNQYQEPAYLEQQFFYQQQSKPNPAFSSVEVQNPRQDQQKQQEDYRMDNQRQIKMQEEIMSKLKIDPNQQERAPYQIQGPQFAAYDMPRTDEHQFLYQPQLKSNPSHEISEILNPRILQQRQQEDYRMDLQRQIQLKEEIKIKLKNDQFQYDRRESDISPYHNVQSTSPHAVQELPLSIHNAGIHQIAQFGVKQEYAPRVEGQPGTRQRTDVTRTGEYHDPLKEQKVLRYQEELRIQMEEQKRRKEEEKKKELMTDLEIERKIQQERAVIKDKERDDILKEGKRDPKEFEDRPKRQVRRDQFATSDENAGVIGDIKRQEQRSNKVEPGVQVPPIKQTSNSDLFSNPERFSSFEPILKNESVINFEHQFKNDVQSFMPTFQQQTSQQQQFAQPSFAPLPQFGNQQSQNDWAADQRDQASKMFQDQQSMIKLYQQTLEQILQYRNQYFEQAMDMRENILKEREQLLEYEKLKQAQITEINQLKAVQGQLGNMLENAKVQQVPMLDQRAQNNLNDYIHKQKESILNLSKSSSQFTEVLNQNKQLLADQNEKKNLYHRPVQNFEFAVSSARVEIPKQNINNQKPQYLFQEDGNDDLQKKVDEIEVQLNQSQEYGMYGARKIEDFEQSLNAESKLVRVPPSNFTYKAQQLQELRSEKQDHETTKDHDLLATWNENSMQKANFEQRPQSNASPLRFGRQNQNEFVQRMNLSDMSNKGQPQLVLGNNLTPKSKLLGKLVGNTSKSPLASSSIPPQTIEEALNENDEDKAIQSQSLKALANMSPQQHNKKINMINQQNQAYQESARRVLSDQDFNNRDSSGEERSPIKQQNYEFQANLKAIERLVNQPNHPQIGNSAFAERRQTMTGSSFYDHTLQNEKIQQAHQQEEVQKQMMRIFGNTSQSYQVMTLDQETISEDKAEDFDASVPKVILKTHNQKSSTMKTNQSQERLQLLAHLQRHQESSNKISKRDDRALNATESEINIANTQVDINLISPNSIKKASSIKKGEYRIQVEEQNQEEDQNGWDDTDLCPPPVFPVYGDDGSQEMIVENNSSVGANTMKQSHGIQQNRFASTSDENNFMGGMGRIPDSVLRTLSPPESRVQKTDYRSQSNNDFDYQDIPDETDEQDEYKTVQKQKKRPFDQIDNRSPKQEKPYGYELNFSPRQEVEESKQSIQSKKEQEMAEIAALIKKATNQTNIVVQIAQDRQNQAPQLISQRTSKGFDQYQKTTPHFQGFDPIMQENKQNPHQITAIQGFKKEPLVTSNDQILADLDKIISNLEAQQKNMQTFGLAKLDKPVSDSEEEAQELQSVQEEQENQESVAQSTKRWKTLADARDARRNQPDNNETELRREAIGKYGKAPLDPKKAPRPKSGKSIKSYKSKEDGSQTRRSNAGDSSPQRVGKYAQMALQNTSQSPMRVGKYANMALQNSPLNAFQENNSIFKSSQALKSPQRVGKYTAMALNKSNSSALKSPQRVGKYAEMALNSSNTNKSNISVQSPGRIGKFAMMALQNQKDAVDVDNISQKYSRALSGSRERQRSIDRTNLVQKLEEEIESRIGGDNNENIVNNGQPILRPLSSVSKSSRYNNGTQVGQIMSSSIVIAPEFRSNTDSNAKFHASEGQQTQVAFKNSGNLRAHTDVKMYGGGQPLQIAQYYSDEDEEFPKQLAYQNSNGGKTDQTELFGKI